MEKKGRGCFFYGCLTTAVIVVLAIIGIYVGARVVGKRILNTYTSTNGVAIAPVTLPRDQGNAAVRKINDFVADLNAGRATGPLELTAEELDYFVRHHKDWAHMREHLHVDINNGRVQAQISFPMQAINPSLKGRFVNATAELTPKVSNGALMIEVNSVKSRGQAVPQKFLGGFQQNISWKPEGAELESVEVRESSVVITPKIKPASPPAEKAP